MLVICLCVIDNVQMLLYSIANWYVVSDVYVYKCRCNLLSNVSKLFFYFHTSITQH